MTDGRTHWEGCFLERGHEACLRHELQKHDCAYFDNPTLIHCAVDHPCTTCRLRKAEADRDRLRATAERAAHILEGYRIWAGTGWHWVSGHPHHANRAWKELRDALKGKQ
jgi:hypothetical protein